MFDFWCKILKAVLFTGTKSYFFLSFARFANATDDEKKKIKKIQTSQTVLRNEYFEPWKG
jgi:hypothetical protein